jgi:hypothetical protein
VYQNLKFIVLKFFFLDYIWSKPCVLNPEIKAGLLHIFKKLCGIAMVTTNAMSVEYRQRK